MSTSSPNLSNQFLKTTREFPKDPDILRQELTRMYQEIAANVNTRSIGIYATSSVINGNTYYLAGDQTKQQSLRQLFVLTSTSTISHGINISNGVLNAYGSYTDGTNWYGMLFASSTAIAGQISFYLTPTSIVPVAGSSPPTLTLGYVVIEWLAN